MNLQKAYNVHVAGNKFSFVFSSTTVWVSFSYLSSEMATPGLQCPLCSHTAHLQLDLTPFFKLSNFPKSCFWHASYPLQHLATMAEAMCSSDVDDTESEDTSLWDNETTSEENTMENGFHDNDLTVDNSVAIQCSFEMWQRSSALYILGAKEKHKLTQSAVQKVIEGVTNLNQLSYTKYEGKNHLHEYHC